MKGHEELATDCFACHAVWRGASPQRCIRCHAVADVGVRTTKGVPIPSRNVKVAFHQELNEQDCMACHETTAWKPATFDHDKYFVLDRDHQAPCETCHKNNDYSRYTCYGCHAHSQAKVRAEHLEEGIRDFENCVECHRNPGVEPGHGGRREGIIRSGHDRRAAWWLRTKQAQ